MAKKKSGKKTVETITHDADKRIPTAEYQPIVQKEHTTPVRVGYERATGNGRALCRTVFGS